MKKANYTRWMLLAVAGIASLSSCTNDKDYYDDNYYKEQYNSNWTKQFGEIDPAQTWNTAAQVTANIDLSNYPSGTYDINIYTANPISDDAYLLATKSTDSQASITFDAPQALTSVFVTVGNATQGLVVNGYKNIADGKVVMSAAASRVASRAEDCPVTIGSDVPMGTWASGNTNWQQTSYGTFKYLSGVEKTSGETWKLGDFYDIVGVGGVFQESAQNPSNRVKWLKDNDKLDLLKGVSYITTQAGEITMQYMFGATAHTKNMFGYYYYTDKKDQLTATRYILMDDASPTKNLTVSNLPDQNTSFENMSLGSWPTNNTEYMKDVNVTGSKYKLTYFDENGNASYEFPAGVHIEFFIIDGKKVQENNIGLGLRYSIPAVNETFLNYSNLYSDWEYSLPEGTGDITAVTYRYGDTTFLGFEDEGSYGDKDMNDILFFVNGNFDKPIDIDPTPEEPKAMEWTLAYEDLGATDDFDFNDVVIKVAHVSGETTATVTLCAAGGTLPATVYYNDAPVGKEVHEAFEVSTSTMINTLSAKTDKEEVLLGTITVPTDFTITKDAPLFVLKVTQRNGVVSSINMPTNTGVAPQCICIAGDWAWPLERINIAKAYTQFGEWGANYSKNDWYNSPEAGTTFSK